MPVKFMNSQGPGIDVGRSRRLDYADARSGAKIINSSFGRSAKSQSLANEIEYAEDKGVLLVIAAGNSTQDIDKDPSYPASYSNGQHPERSPLSPRPTRSPASPTSAPRRWTSELPGNNIVSTYPTSTYKVLSGTSMATPYVTAAAAMLLRAEQRVSPTASCAP